MAESSDSSVFATITEEGDGRNPRKRRRSSKWQKTMEDQISGLPDSILHEILSLLPSTREAIRTGTLSMRWKYLWTSLPTLIFDTHDFRESAFGVYKTLLHCRHTNLKKLRLHLHYDEGDESQLRDLIRYAVDCNVQEICLDFGYNPAFFELPGHLFTNGYLTTLSLAGAVFDPLRVVNWKNLKSLYLKETNLTKDWIDSILQGTPALEIMELCLCFGFRRLEINSTSVKKLVLDGYYGYDDDLEVFAPNILSLNITSVLHLRKVVLRDVSSLVEANLEYTVVRINNYTYEVVLENEEMEEDMLKGFIKSLNNVKELKIGEDCYQVLSRLKAKGLAFLPNMKFPVDSPFHACSDSLEDQPNVNGGTTLAAVDTARMTYDYPPRNDGKRPVPEAFGVWNGHKVLQSHVELLKAVEQQYPHTFGYLQVRAERVWEAYLEEFGNVITSFLQTSVSDLTENRMSDIRENLHELGVYGFDVAWAFDRLQKVEELQFWKPFQQELGKLNLNLHSLDEKIARLELQLADARDRRIVLVKERDEKVAEVNMRLGVDYDHLVAASLGFGLLVGYKPTS